MQHTILTIMSMVSIPIKEIRGNASVPIDILFPVVFSILCTLPQASVLIGDVPARHRYKFESFSFKLGYPPVILT